jgi:hypothetical protein
MRIANPRDPRPAQRRSEIDIAAKLSPRPRKAHVGLAIYEYAERESKIFHGTPSTPAPGRSMRLNQREFS